LIKYLKNEKRSVSTETVYNYLEYCKEACLLHLVPRQNLEGKEILSTQEKIFITDHGIRQALFMKNQKDINQILENIVYIELLRRGYSVTVGKAKNQEIDFCAQNENGIEYFQVCYLLASDETVEREFGVFRGVKDNYPKFVLSLDDFDFSQDGIIHKNLVKWLLEKD
jgi:predicted AAA+ superfamily ATPase